MDELWQRHKVFIVQCVIGSIVLLITWAIHSNLYDDIDVMQGNNTLRKSQLEKWHELKGISRREAWKRLGMSAGRDSFSPEEISELLCI